MADHRIHAPVESRPGGHPAAAGRPDASHPHPPHPGQICTPAALGAEVKDEQTRRFQLAAWLLEEHSKLGAQRAHSALLLVLGNVLLVASAFLLLFLIAVINPDWWWVLIGASVIMVLALLSTVFALLVGTNLQAGGSSAAVEAGLFFQSGQALTMGETQFRKLFQRVTWQQMLEGALAELYAQGRHQARQERWMRLAMAAFALALLLFTLTVVVIVGGAVF